MAHFTVWQRSPFRKSFMPSRRQSRHFGPMFRAMCPASACGSAACGRSDAAALARPASVVGQRRDVLDGLDVHPRLFQGADRGLAAGAGTLDLDLDFLDSEL